VKITIALIGLFLLTTVSAAQPAKSAKDKAPAGCIPCEALCTWCASLGLQPKDTSKCHQGCRSWGSMVGLKTVYVQKNRSLCGGNSYAPRCN
jgi:hypothetical protein